MGAGSGGAVRLITGAGGKEPIREAEEWKYCGISDVQLWELREWEGPARGSKAIKESVLVVEDTLETPDVLPH